MKIFDAHLHIIDPRFPLAPNNGYLPPEFAVADYRSMTDSLGVVGGAVVSGSFQRFDQSYLIAALRHLGEGFVGVTQLPASVSDDEIQTLDAKGVRAVRFNLHRGGSAGLDDMATLAARVHDLAGWHSEVYVDGADLDALEPVLRALPRVVIDHLGLRRAGQRTLLRLVDSGARVKATGFGRLDFAPGSFLRRIADIDPGALLFGTDLPSTRAPRAFERADLELLLDSLDPEEASRAVYENAVALYRPRDASG